MTDEEPSDLEKLNALYGRAQWRLTQSRQEHVDEFGDRISPRELEYIRDVSFTFNAVRRLSVRSFNTLVRLVLDESPALNDIVTSVALERKQTEFEEMREAMNRASVARGDTAIAVEAERERRNQERDVIHPRHREWVSITPEELQRAVWSKPTLQLSRDFGVSNVAIGKKCKALGVKKPSPGFWRRVETGKVDHPSGIPTSDE